MKVSGYVVDSSARPSVTRSRGPAAPGRVVLEDEEAFEEGRAAGHLAPALHLHQRRVLVLSRLRLRPLQLAQPGALPRPAAHPHTHRKRVEEEADRLLHPL